MILDSSALVAILLDEPEADELLERLAGAPAAAVGAPTLAETAIVLTARLGPPGQTLLARFIAEAGVEVASFTDDHWAVAGSAYARFGKGRHPAALNFGDCLTYAVARLAAEPLLCAGDDFRRTDLDVIAV